MSRPVQADGRVHGVIVGCRRDDGRWLLIRRSRLVAAPRRVCFPGGAMEPGEPEDSAAVREMFEELGARVELVGRVWNLSLAERPLTLWGWLAHLANPHELRPNPDEVEEMLWLTAAEIESHIDAMPNTNRFVRALEEAVSKGAVRDT